jgi:transketolase
MRNEFSQSLEKLALEDDSIVFITGDLGYAALENLQAKMGKRFINAGVAEQNMVGVAAGFAHKGFKVFCYSIAPFVVYRCLEQFRNDVCFHNLPVFLVGNGGGYGYGIMGSSHHALEDLACLSSMQNVTTWIPGFSDEVEPFVSSIVDNARPAYLRLGAGKKTPENSTTSGSFKLVNYSPTATTTLITLGPVVNNALAAVADLGADVNILSVFNLPLQLSSAVVEILEKAPDILVVEEHVSIGGLGQQLGVQLLERGVKTRSFTSLRAQGYPNGRYGSQNYHQKISGIDPQSLIQHIANLSKTL